MIKYAYLLKNQVFRNNTYFQKKCGKTMFLQKKNYNMLGFRFARYFGASWKGQIEAD